MSVLTGTVVAGESEATRLESSPRHHEWVDVPAGDRQVRSFVVYPERAGNALAVIVIHENRGLTDWVRGFADRLAEAGYVAIAPDLLSDFDPEHDGTGDFASADAAREALYALDPGRVMSDLLAVQEYAGTMAGADGRTAAAGFCWGGSQAFRMATEAPGLEAVFVFYGSPPPDPEFLSRIAAPVYGFYGRNDQRINATIPQTEERMARLGKTYDYVIYEDAGHAFMRQGDAPDAGPGLRQARDAAWTRLLRILGGL